MQLLIGQMLAGLKEKMVEINGGQPLATSQERPLFHVESKVDGYCGLCNVDGCVVDRCVHHTSIVNRNLTPLPKKTCPPF